MGKNKKNKRKVVYNSCYGGFGLSPEATIMYYKLKNPGKEVYIYNVSRDGCREIYTRTLDIPGPKSFSLDYVLLEKDFGETFEFVGGEKNMINPRYCEFNDNYIYFSSSDIIRHDPDLVRIVEELGSERASASCSRLEIMDIGDNRYHISEYDGLEKVITDLGDDYWH